MKHPTNDISRMESEIIRGLEGMRDALRDGQKLQARFTMRTVELELDPRPFSPEEVQKLRHMFHASQAVFARMIGISPSTLQNWEQGRTSPPAWASRLLQIIQTNPDPWSDLLEKSTRSKTFA